ncbi:MAG: amidohydrolase family protein [Pseudomonadota bacterium]
MRKLIKNAHVVSVDPAIGNLAGADILVEDGLITAIGHGLGADAAEQVDATGCIAIPGFVDTHRHLWEGAMRSVTADYSILDFSGNIRLFAAGFFRPEDMYATALQGSLESLNAGVTTSAEYCHNVRTPEHALEGVRGVKESGSRTTWSYSFTGLAKQEAGGAAPWDRLSFLKKLAASEFSGSDSLLTLGVCPEEPSHWPADVSGVLSQFRMARELGARMFMHCNSRISYEGRMPRDVQKLRDLGLLGPDVILVHMCVTDDDEWTMMGDAGAHISYTPETEYQMGLGFPSVSAPQAAGVNVSVGVDITANNSADMFTQLRMLLQVERARKMELTQGANSSRTAYDCHEALYWGTMGGAKALGLEHKVGSLTPGKAADIVLLRADDITTAGWDRRNPAATVIQQMGIHNVESVLVGGQFVKRAGRLLADERSACSKLQATSDYIHEQALRHGGFDVSEEALYKRIGRKKMLAPAAST